MSSISLGTRDERVVTRWASAAAIALGAHGALALGADGHAPPRPAPAVVTEVELSPPSLPERPPAPTPEPKPEPELPPITRAEPNLRAETSPRTVARAQNVLVAQPDPQAEAKDEPVDFVTDPNGRSYQGSVVARGGTGDGQEGARAFVKGPAAPGARAAPPPRPKSDITPPSDLSRRPSMLAGGGCSGYYPRQADADSAVVTVVAVVGPGGTAAGLTLAGESPAGQGFGAAARACLRQSRFSPGLDRAGRPVKAVVMVRVRFTR